MLLLGFAATIDWQLWSEDGTESSSSVCDCQRLTTFLLFARSVLTGYIPQWGHRGISALVYGRVSSFFEIMVLPISTSLSNLVPYCVFSQLKVSGFCTSSCHLMNALRISLYAAFLPHVIILQHLSQRGQFNTAVVQIYSFLSSSFSRLLLCTSPRIQWLTKYFTSSSKGRVYRSLLQILF